MQKLIMIKSGELKYSTQKSKGDTIYLLDWFLNDTSLRLIPFYIEWAKDPTQYHQPAGNISELYKKDNTVSIGFSYSDQEDDGPFFEILLDDFVYLLTTWYKLVSQGARKIIMTEQDGKVTIEGQ